MTYPKNSINMPSLNAKKNILADIKMANTLKYRWLLNEYANIICVH